MTDALTELLTDIADGKNEQLIPAILAEFPSRPELTWQEKKAEAKAYEKLAEQLDEANSLFVTLNPSWLEAFFGLTEDRQKWLAKLPEQLSDAAKLINDGKTGGRQPAVFTNAIAVWCIETIEKLAERRPNRGDDDLANLFDEACIKAGTPYAPAASEVGGDYWPLRRALGRLAES